MKTPLLLNDEYSKRKEYSRTVNIDMDIVVDEPVVVAIIKVNGKAKARGIARCCPDDVFNETRGFHIAARRAVIDLCNKQLQNWV
jgi:hypothetical protein